MEQPWLPPVVYIHNYSLCFKIEKNEMGGHVARMGEMGDVCWILVGKREGKRPLGRPRHIWENKIWIFRKWDVEV